MVLVRKFWRRDRGYEEAINGYESSATRILKWLVNHSLSLLIIPTITLSTLFLDNFYLLLINIPLFLANIFILSKKTFYETSRLPRNLVTWAGLITAAAVLSYFFLPPVMTLSSAFVFINLACAYLNIVYYVLNILAPFVGEMIMSCLRTLGVISSGVNPSDYQLVDDS